MRFTTDNWNTHDEVPALFIPSTSPSITCTSTYNIYDNFSFSIPLPSSSLVDKIEFCIRYSGDNFEYWDNNNGKNFVAVCFRPKTGQIESKPQDLYDVTIDSWSEFACWNHLTLNDSPYY